jgi:cytoskeletal protein CcmA (bactofilin family)
MWKRDQGEAPATPQRTPETPPPASSPPVEPLVMNLGDSVIIKGELSGSEDLTLYGQMQGRIKLPAHTLTIGPHAEIKADIVAKAVVIAGAVVGTVTASERVEIQASGSVTGDILSPRLTIADGGYFLGKIDMSRPEGQPRPEKAPRT